MIQNPIPTRAESSDVANAIFDGTDAVMLSAETAAGSYPIEAASEILRIAVEAEESPYMPTIQLDRDLALNGNPINEPSISFAMAQATDSLAKEMNANAVMVFCDSTEQARLLSYAAPAESSAAATVYDLAPIIAILGLCANSCRTQD